MALKRKRRAMTLLELVIATSMLAMVMTAISVVMRTSRQAWEAHEADYLRIEAAHATLRHIVRQVRQAEAVTEISAATDTSGRIGLLLPNGDTRVWDHDGGTNTVNCGITTADDMLAPNITGLTFVGFRADGATMTSDPTEIQCLRVDVSVQLPRETSGARTVSSWAWVRSW